MPTIANRTAEGMGLARPRRSCLSVPANVERMTRKAGSLPADEVFLDLEDAVAPSEKEHAREAAVDALTTVQWGEQTVAVRINAIDTRWAYRDVVDVVEAAGAALDCLIVPKVQAPGEVEFVDHLLRMIEDSEGLEHRIGLEAQIETAAGLTLVDEIAHASERLEALVFGPGDMAASLGMPSLTVGEMPADYPGDHWHAVLVRVLVAARTAGLQAIDGPYADLADVDGLRQVARRSQQLGFDGKWVVHPDQIEVVNDTYTPGRAEYERAEDLLATYRRATEEDRAGTVRHGDELVDEASRKMAEVVAVRGRAAGITLRPAGERGS